MRHSGSVIKSMDSGAILPGLNPVLITYYIHEPQISHLKSRNNNNNNLSPIASEQITTKVSQESRCGLSGCLCWTFHKAAFRVSANGLWFHLKAQQGKGLLPSSDSC